MNRRQIRRSSRQLTVGPQVPLGLPVPYSHPTPQRPAGEDFIISPASAVQTIRRYWLIVLPLSGLLAVGVCALVWYLFEPQYRAAAWIQIQDRNPYLVTEDYEPPEASRQFIETQIELLSGPLVIEAALKNPVIASLAELQAAENPADLIAESILVLQVGKSEMYQVAYTGPHPEHAATIANAIVDEYFNLRDAQQVERTDRMIQLLEEERQRRALIVRGLRDQMRTLSNEVFGRPLLDPTSRDSMLAHPLQALQDRLTEAEVERHMLEIQAMQESAMGAEATVSDYLVEQMVDETTEIQDLRAVLAEKRAILQRTASVTKLGMNDPSCRRLEAEIAAHERTLNDALDRVRPRVREKLEAMAGLDRQRQQAELQARVEMQRSIENMLRERYQAQMKDLGEAAGSSLELEFLRAELAREEKIFDLIGDRVTTLRTETRAPGRVSRVRMAEPPDAPVQSLPLKHFALATLLSICLPWGGVFAWEYYARPIRNAEQIQKQSQMSVLAEIARLPLQARVRAAAPRAVGRDLGVYEESIDSLRTCLTLSEPSRRMTSFAITSAVSGEGKTSIAAQLAVSLARSSHARVVLVDADMRAPDMHRLFHVRLAPGLAQVLDGQCPLNEALVTSWSEHLHILPAGKLHKNPHKLVAGDAFATLLEQLRRSYDCVVIDTAPLLAASESLVIAREADGVVLCAMRDRSREDQLQRAHARLIASGARSVGAVLNGVPTKWYARTYGSYPHVS